MVGCWCIRCPGILVAGFEASFREPRGVECTRMLGVETPIYMSVGFSTERDDRHP